MTNCMFKKRSHLRVSVYRVRMCVRIIRKRDCYTTVVLFRMSPSFGPWLPSPYGLTIRVSCPSHTTLGVISLVPGRMRRTHTTAGADTRVFDLPSRSKLPAFGQPDDVFQSARYLTHYHRDNRPIYTAA